MMVRKLCTCLMIALLVSACAQKTMILSDPPGARVAIDGKDVCTTPCTYDYTSGSSGETHQVTLEMDGYEPILYEVKADEVDREARSTLWTAGMMIPGGSLLWVGSLFTNKLKESYRFVLQEEAPIVAMHEGTHKQ